MRTVAKSDNHPDRVGRIAAAISDACRNYQRIAGDATARQCAIERRIVQRKMIALSVFVTVVRENDGRRNIT